MVDYERLNTIKKMVTEEVEKYLEDAYTIGYTDCEKETKGSDEDNYNLHDEEVLKKGVEIGYNLARRIFSDDRVTGMYEDTPRNILFNHTAECVMGTCQAIDERANNCEDNVDHAYNYDELVKKVIGAVTDVLEECGIKN